MFTQFSTAKLVIFFEKSKQFFQVCFRGGVTGWFRVDCC